MSAFESAELFMLIFHLIIKEKPQVIGLHLQDIPSNYRQSLQDRRFLFFFCMTLFTDLLSADNNGIDFHATLLSDQDALRHGIIYTGALFFTATTIMFDGIAELPTTKTKLPVFSRQRELFFFPALTYSIPPCMLKIPIKIDCCMGVPNLL